jgi:hypothetical protein
LRVDVSEERVPANMTLQIDDDFITKWEREYDDPQIGGDEEEYKTLVSTVARELKSIGTISKATFLDIWSWKGPCAWSI